MRYFYAIFFFVCVATVSILGLRGTKFTEPPLFIFPDMDWQDKYKPQGMNPFFSDARDARPVVPGTIVRGHGWDNKAVFSSGYKYAPALNPELYSGKDENGDFLKAFPLPLTHELMVLGKDKFNNFCYACHGKSGDGNGITKRYGMIATASYHDDRMREMAVGEIFNTVTHGFGMMNSYADKLTPEERWAVILYVRALQRSQNATVDDVPVEFRADLGL